MHQPRSGTAQPTLALRQRLARLSPEKLAALQRRLESKPRSGYEPVAKSPNQESYPLSLHQQRLWFIEQLRPGTPLYNVARATRILGPLNKRALHSALQLLVDRHETLRTTFHLQDSGPAQRISASRVLKVSVVDLRPVADDRADLESLLAQKLTEESRRTFDLAADLMLRTVLYQIDDDEHVLSIVMHHLVCDGWSLQLLFDELAVFYRNGCAEQRLELPPKQLRYVDFVRWQRQPRQQKMFAKGVQWWKDQLADAPQMLELTTDRPRPQIESGAGEFEPLRLSSELRQQLERLGQQEDATLFMTLLAGFFILLHRFTRMEDFLVGSATTGRNRAETHGMIGFFVDTVVLRADLSGSPSARQVLRRVRHTLLEAIEHSDVPFDYVVDSLNLPKDLSRHPLFQVFFNAPPQYSLQLHGLQLSPIHVAQRIARFDLEMSYSSGPNRQTGISWATGLFSSNTIRRMCGHYTVLLEAIAADPDRPVRQLPLLSDNERQQLLLEWNRTDVEFPHDRCLHQLFERQVEQTPDATAVAFEGQHVTYRELNRHANRLAHHLIRKGVGPNVLVAICLDRSVEMIVGLLAIFKAGGAYVPLDPTYPSTRLAFMLEDCRAVILLTESKLASIVPTSKTDVICQDTVSQLLTAENERNPRTTSNSQQLAYVIYTSGSTGKPKGVEISHQALVNLLASMGDCVRMTDRDVLLAVTTLSFDIAAMELYLPIILGARVEMVSRETAANGEQLSVWIARSGATIMQATPATWQILLELGWRGNQQLKLLCGGEPLATDLAQRLLPRCRSLWNVYGPTETTIWSCAHHVRSFDGPVPIGRPLANTQVYLLDGHLQPVPIGVPGELCIGGIGLARGYLMRPELTAERFVRNPFSESPSNRLYKTGDLARYGTDGTIEFLGRMDNQVKLRGYRIELGEIEAVLAQHPGVRRAVADIREDIPGDKRLVAYVVPSDASLTSHQLRQHLKAQLPSYMLPSVFVQLDVIPLTPNGKIARSALPIPTFPAAADSSDRFVAPRDEFELRLTELWQELLGTKRISVTDDFFRLGGHSLLAVRLMSKIERAFGRSLPLASVFRASTIEQLAALIGQEQTQPGLGCLVALHEKGTKPPLFCIAGHDPFVFRSLPDHLGENQPLYGLQYPGMDGRRRPFQRIEDIAAEFTHEIRSVQPTGPYYVLGHCAGGLVAYEIAQQLSRTGHQVALLAMCDTTHVGSTTQLLWVQRSWLQSRDFLRSDSKRKSKIIKKHYSQLKETFNRLTTAVLDVVLPHRASSIVTSMARVDWANRRARRDYRPRLYSGDVLLLRSIKPTKRWKYCHVHPSLGWDQLVRGELKTHTIRSSHGNLLKEPKIRRLAKIVRDHLSGG